MTPQNSFLGVGWRWPLGVGRSGSVAMSAGLDQVEQAMFLILSTEPGERPMRPEFGARLRRFVFAMVNASTAAAIAAEARSALERWEPRVVVDDVDVSTDSDNPALLWVDVTYTVKATNDRRNLVCPFYVIPSHGDEVPALAGPGGGASR